MDQIKIGKLITKKRLEKKLTQSELGDLIGVTDKAVSKWERGINIPDIALIQPLSEILNISISELLSGEENPKEDNQVVDGIKFYNKRLKNKFMAIVIGILIILILVLGLFFINNYNQCEVYSLDSNNKDYRIHGYLIFNPNENIIVLDEITYQGELLGTSDEPYITKMVIMLKVKETIIERIELFDINNILSIALNEKSIAFEDFENEKLKRLKSADKKDVYLEFEFYDENNNKTNTKIELDFSEKFTNNRLVYRKK